MDLSHQQRLAGGLTELQHEFIIERPHDDVSEDFLFCPAVTFKREKKPCIFEAAHNWHNGSAGLLCY